MTDLRMLTHEIESSGLKVVTLCERAGIKRGTFYARMNGTGEFTASEIDGLSRALHLTKKRRDDIFFAKG